MEHTLPQHHGDTKGSRIFVILIGGPARQRASICHAAVDGIFHVEPVWAVGELGLRELTTVDVILAWDEGDTIEELKGHLAILARWVPIIAISERPITAQVVEAMKAGAIDYVDWTGAIEAVQVAVTAAAAARRKLLPKKQWQSEVRRLLRTLSPREHQVLTLMTDGITNKEIAKALQISPRTVEIHRANLMRKLRVINTVGAVRIALEGSATSGWIFGDNWLAAGSLVGSGNDNA